MSVVTVCKNVIASNNKRGWKDPEPAIRVARTKSGNVTERGNVVLIFDKDGEEIAKLISTTNGKPIVKCGAKVALFTKYDVITDSFKYGDKGFIDEDAIYRTTS